MPEFEDDSARKKWEETGRLLKRRQSIKAKKPISEMDLTEALDAQKKYLAWIEKYPNHEDRQIKEHVYKTYLLPRIEELEFSDNSQSILGIKEPHPELANKQLTLGGS